MSECLKAKNSARPLIFGLNGPQGCGKTTATSAAVEMLRDKHQLRGITVSIDDFYLTRAEQVRLAAQNAANPYLQQRGYPGTHDIRLGSETLANLRAINSSQQPVPVSRSGQQPTAIPRYDKSAHGGEGDRLPQSNWPLVRPPLDYVILEGWCVGFSPLPESVIPNAHLLEVNRYLARYAEWHAFFDAFIQLKAQNIRDTVRWRIEAEQNMRAQGKPGMSDERVRAYIEQFMPAYELYLPGLDSAFAASLPRLVIELGADRSVLRATGLP